MPLGTLYSRLNSFKSERVINDCHIETAYLEAYASIYKGLAPIEVQEGLGGLASLGPFEHFGAT